MCVDNRLNAMGVVLDSEAMNNDDRGHLLDVTRRPSMKGTVAMVWVLL